MGKKLSSAQRAIVKGLQNNGAVSSETATTVFGVDWIRAKNLVARGVLNHRYGDALIDLFWVRQEGEASATELDRAGWIVILNQDLIEPGGKSVNFFLARAIYDGSNKTFQKLISGWLKELGLPRRAVLQDFPIEQIDYDHKMFANKDHIIKEYP